MPTRGSYFWALPAWSRASCTTTSSAGAGGRVRGVGERDAGRAAEVADELLRGLAVVVGVVERDLAGRAAEAEARVGQHRVAAGGEGLADAGLVVLRPAEAVGGQDGRHAVAALAPAGVYRSPMTSQGCDAVRADVHGEVQGLDGVAGAAPAPVEATVAAASEAGDAGQGSETGSTHRGLHGERAGLLTGNNAPPRSWLRTACGPGRRRGRGWQSSAMAGHRSSDDIDLELATNLVTRVNVGDALTRTAGRHARRAGRRRRRAALDLRRAQRLGEPGRERAGRARLRAAATPWPWPSGNSAEFLVTYFACAKLGVVCVPLNLGWRAGRDRLRARPLRGRAASSSRPNCCRAVLPGVEKVPAVQRRRSSPPGTGGDVRRRRCPTARGRRFDDAARRRPTPSPRSSSTSATRSATCTRAARRRSPRAWSAATSRSTSSR